MDARTMQALVVVFPEYFPIALDGLEQDVADDQLSQGPRVEPVQRQIEYLFKGRRTIGQGNEDEPIPFPDADLVEGKIGHVEAAGVSLGRRAQQVPLQVVDPGVVRTNDAARPQYSLGLAAQGRAAMPAGVVKPLQGTLIGAHQEHPLVAQFKGTERARPRHVAGPAGIDPVAVQNAPQFPFVLTRVVVGIRRQAFGMFGKTVVAQVDRGRSQHRLPLVTTKKSLFISRICYIIYFNSLKFPRERIQPFRKRPPFRQKRADFDGDPIIPPRHNKWIHPTPPYIPCRSSAKPPPLHPPSASRSPRTPPPSTH